jgi:hypothetical protein
MIRRDLIKWATGAALLPLAGCAGRQSQLRFRLQMAAKIGARVVRASSVRETWYYDDPSWFPSDGAGQFGWRGEATMLDLGGGRLLAAMLDGYTTINGYRERSYAPWDPATVVMERMAQTLPKDPVGRAIWSDVGGPPTFSELKAWLQRGPLMLGPHELPVLVAFATAAIPGSGLVIEPSRLPEVFPDVSLGRCTVRLTSERVRFGAAEVALPWLRDRPGKATIYTPPFKTGRVMTHDFQRR